MKKIIYLLVLFPIIAIGQVGSLIRETTYKQATLIPISTPTTSQASVTISYFDGLNRPIQEIALGLSGTGKDIVIHKEYDGFGRESRKYLPYASTLSGNTSFRTNALSETNGFYNIAKYENTLNPYTEFLFENSPSNKVLKVAAAGNDWKLDSGHEIKMDYQYNIVGEVKKHLVTTTWIDSLKIYVPAISQTLNYDINQLTKTVTKDENWISTDLKNRTIEEFKDKEGKLILKRTYDLSQALDTYYAYDEYGNLSYVIPPLGNSAVDQTTLNNLCFQYRYDNYNRLVEKKIPGKDWEYIVYDKANRVIMTQDSNLRVSNKWLFIKYDALDRPVYTGDYKNITQKTRIAIQNLADLNTTLYEIRQVTERIINGTSINYSNNAFPNLPDSDINTNILTINYYDNYNNFNLSGGVSETAYGTTPNTNVKGLSTGSKIRILGTTNWITNISYYDAKYRPIYLYSYNDYLKTTDKVKNNFDFEGKTIATTSTHLRTNITPNTNVQITNSFTYDNAGRLLTQKQIINNQAEETIVSNTYDELGQLTSKGVGGKTTQTRLQNVNYTYNIRGWLKGINDINTMGTDLFAFQISYNTPTSGTPLFNGNISQTFWKTANTNTSLRNYNYTYDALNRLTNAIDSEGFFTEGNIVYDKNGNIINLKRKGAIVAVPSVSTPANFGFMDDLTYTYTGNRLMKVADASATDQYGFKDDAVNTAADTVDDYAYDNNGNMKSDANKAITAISYNHLNLPTQITLASGTINYVYDATGVKQSKVVGAITTDYAGGFQYENNVLQFFPQPEGYVANNSGTFNYIYQYKDHLGNVRLSYGDNNNDGSVTTTEIVEESNYYPFGLKQSGYNNAIVLGKGNSTGQKYKYNGKELQDELGLNITAMDFRMYDNALGRFSAPDPLTDLFTGISPYAFAENNPIVFSDPSGLCPECEEYYKNHNEKPTNGTTYTSVGGGVYKYSNGNWTRQDGELREVVIGGKKNNSFPDSFPDRYNVWSGFRIFGPKVVINSGGSNGSRRQTDRPVLNYKEDPRFIAKKHVDYVPSVSTQILNNVSDLWNSTSVRLMIPDRIYFSVSYNANPYIGNSTEFSLNWITRGNDASLIPYSITTVAGTVGMMNGGIGIGAGGGYFLTTDMRSLSAGTASNAMLGWSYTGTAFNAVDGGRVSLTGSIGIKGTPFSSDVITSVTGGASVGFGTPGAGVYGGVSYSTPSFGNKTKF
ncbi:RHS repeat-associated protein [Flavobacterium cutihirudinis]|uniref:RHS repeat-associated protein n=1 Tax=Flavobacterium cutihirudinis TaxID=1265740 RepID=A0A3D9FZ18_9FLAO|nr:DUF6443 domain-containing protein [Flavobacterium cutihirudinis]RED26113.1 RHS repeat-associated protein [Flavobacterium cutihirudinis]